jgi:transcriptional regulator with XRE-family HTH domain
MDPTDKPEPEKPEKPKIPDTWLEHVSAALKSARSSRTMSQRDLAKLVGVTGGAVGQWEKKDPPEAWWRLRNLAEVLGVSADALLNLPGRGPDVKKADRHLERAVAEMRLAQKTYRSPRRRPRG